MSLIAALVNGGSIVETIGSVIDDLFTSDEERLEKELEIVKAERDHNLELRRLTTEQNIAQIEVNAVEAASNNLFVAGWRPAIGWIGAITLFYQFVLYPLLLWLPIDKPPPQIDAEALWTMITGMLGIAGMRSYDKFKKTDTKQVKG